MELIYSYISNLLASNQFLQGGFVLGIITTIFYQIKSLPILFFNKCKYFATYEIYFDESSEFYRVFAEWFNEKYPQKFKNVEVKLTFESTNDGDIRPREGIERDSKIKISKTQYADSNVIFYKKRWLWVQKNRKTLETARDFHSMFLNSYTISGFFAKNAIDELCKQILERKNAERSKRTLRVGINDGGYIQWRDVETVKTFKHLFFTGKDKLINDLNTFVQKKEFYKEKGINFKRSYLFYGRGGTGKTSIATAIAKHLDFDLFVVGLPSIKNDAELEQLSSRLTSKCVILLEDIDCVLTNREVANKQLNFSTVLNFLDGIYAPSDCIFVMTTNKPEVLDEALTRKGRVDLAMLIDYPSLQLIEEYVSDFYNVDFTLPKGVLIEKPMAEIQDICLQNQNAEQAKQAILALAIPVNGKKQYAVTA